MAELDDALAQYSIEAVRSAAERLEVEPLFLARRLHDGEIWRLIKLLQAALPHVSHPGLRHRIEDLLVSVTNGKLPMFGEPESELDWALETLRERRRKAGHEESPDPPAP
jgi:hypothetical protein